jgi:hypothetical protein
VWRGGVTGDADSRVAVPVSGVCRVLAFTLVSGARSDQPLTLLSLSHILHVPRLRCTASAACACRETHPRNNGNMTHDTHNRTGRTLAHWRAGAVKASSTNKKEHGATCVRRRGWCRRRHGPGRCSTDGAARPHACAGAVAPIPPCCSKAGHGQLTWPWRASWTASRGPRRGRHPWSRRWTGCTSRAGAASAGRACR